MIVYLKKNQKDDAYERCGVWFNPFSPTPTSLPAPLLPPPV